MTASSDLDFAAAFGRRVAMAREQRTISQRLLSSLLAELGVTMDSAALSRLEQGKRAPKLQEAAAIADALRMSLADLMPPKDMQVSELARVQHNTLEHLDNALYKLTAAAAAMDYFAGVVEANAEDAAELWPPGISTWQEWAEWAADGLIEEDSPRLITPSSLDRFLDLQHAMRFLAERVLSRPYDPNSDVVEIPEVDLRNLGDGDHGEHPAAT